MLINLIVYIEDMAELVNRTRIHFNSRIVESRPNVIWLSNMYLEFCEKMITINVIKLNSCWQKDINEYLHSVFAGKKVFISCSDYSERYFRSFPDAPNAVDRLVSYSG